MSTSKTSSVAPADHVVASTLHTFADDALGDLRGRATGSPAISLTLGLPREGLPIGMHFLADHELERVLLELAFELEAAKPFARLQDARRELHGPSSS